MAVLTLLPEGALSFGEVIAQFLLRLQSAQAMVRRWDHRGVRDVFQCFHCCGVGEKVALTMRKAFPNTDACIQVEFFINIRASNILCNCFLRGIRKVLEMLLAKCDISPWRDGWVDLELG